jgi:predicted amidohydrolase
MRVALVQNHPVFGMKSENIDRLFALMEKTDADLYVLPELAYSGYQFVSKEDLSALAESADGSDAPSIKAFGDLARRKNAAMVFGFPEKTPGGCYNSSLAVLPDGSRYLYRKTHLFYKEKLYFRPGDTGFFVFDFRGARIGPAICFDWFFPESFRTLALLGADVIAHSSNLVMPYCQQADFCQALVNRVYIATANRIGTEHREEESLTFTGESVLVSPRGEYLARAAKDREEVITSDIDIGLSRNKKINAYNEVFAERRPEMYTCFPKETAR